MFALVVWWLVMGLVSIVFDGKPDSLRADAFIRKNGWKCESTGSPFRMKN